MHTWHSKHMIIALSELLMASSGTHRTGGSSSSAPATKASSSEGASDESKQVRFAPAESSEEAEEQGNSSGAAPSAASADNAPSTSKSSSGPQLPPRPATSALSNPGHRTGEPDMHACSCSGRYIMPFTFCFEQCTPRKHLDRCSCHELGPSCIHL